MTLTDDSTFHYLRRSNHKYSSYLSQYFNTNVISFKIYRSFFSNPNHLICEPFFHGTIFYISMFTKYTKICYIFHLCPKKLTFGSWNVFQPVTLFSFWVIYPISTAHLIRNLQFGTYFSGAHIQVVTNHIKHMFSKIFNTSATSPSFEQLRKILTFSRPLLLHHILHLVFRFVFSTH